MLRDRYDPTNLFHLVPVPGLELHDQLVLQRYLAGHRLFHRGLLPDFADTIAFGAALG